MVELNTDALRQWSDEKLATTLADSHAVDPGVQLEASRRLRKRGDRKIVAYRFRDPDFSASATTDDLQEHQPPESSHDYGADRTPSTTGDLTGSTGSHGTFPSFEPTLLRRWIRRGGSLSW